MEVVVERLALAEELGREDDVVRPEALPHAHRVTDGDGGLDDHRRVRVDLDDVADDALHGGGVEVVRHRVVVGRRRDDDVLRTLVRLVLVEGEPQVEVTGREEGRDLLVVDRAPPGLEHLDPGGVDVEADDLVVPGEEDGHGQADVTGADDGDSSIHTDPCLLGARRPRGGTSR